MTSAPTIEPDPRLVRVLDAPVFATVATINPDGTPQQSVVWIGRDGSDLLFVAAADSRKHKNLSRDPRVSVLVNPPEAPYTSAVLKGVATLEPTGGRRLLDRLSFKYHGRGYRDAHPESAADLGELVTVRVTVNKIVSNV
ncbi:hypothetical protein GCM10009678_00140 [Actinomadura kijaniata]|uniref:PPOX class probable F420-dependent enzyme n=1 Tax=Actinomadura namibiensis TaxID=182080 RepID=A0A7W3QNW0_ACTNM|nr:PPOX class F420-dependent oxidoreductase [Actinomadura namibiensis]MBA8953458.1 PPOX class probable F420-dependent enzyme [Actinomadura namibiensis]